MFSDLAAASLVLPFKAVMLVSASCHCQLTLYLKLQHVGNKQQLTLLLLPADALCDPLDTKQTFVEELVRMPNCFLCYTPATGKDVTYPPFHPQLPLVIVLHFCPHLKGKEKETSKP